MTLEQTIADLTVATTDLLGSVNVSKASLDAKVNTATDRANAAAASAQTANDTLLQTQYARDQAIAGLGAADNSQLVTEFAGQDSYAADLAGQAVRELAGLPGGVEAVANFMTSIMDLVGAAGRQSAAAAQVVPAPANASARGSPGEWAWDSNYVYVAVALNTWKRAAITTW